jgi:hypothetical protein
MKFHKSVYALTIFFLTQLFLGASTPRPSQAAETQILSDFEDGTFTNYLEGESGAWDSDPEDETAFCEAEIADMPGPEDSSRALKLTYDVESESTEPVPIQNGFWTKLRNFDAREYDHLEFFVKGDPEAGFTTKFRVELKKFKDEERVEKLRGGFIVENVTSEWQKISIPLNKMTGILNFTDPAVWKDPSVGRKDLDEFVVVFEGRRVDRKTGVIYFDNFRFVRTGTPGPSAVDFPPRKKGDKTPVPLEGLEYAKFLAGRLQGFPEKTAVKKDFPADDRKFLLEVARDTWRFFDEIVDREHQLPLDTIQLGEEAPLAGEVFVGDYTNVTNIGLYFMTLVAAYDLGFISREEAVRRSLSTIQSVEKLEFHAASGFLYNYYDTTTAERTSYFVSFVDSGWLAAGLYVVKNAFPAELEQACARLLARWNFDFFYDDVDQQMVHGYYDHLGVYSDYHYGTFYTEPRAVSAIAIGRGEVPLEHWYRIQRTFPEDYVWQEQEPKNRIKKKGMGINFYGGYYEWNGLRYVPSWGGSLFEALMPALILRERESAPEGLGLNNQMHVRGHIRYALEELKYPVWGMSPSSDPDGGYSEFGVKPLGCKGYKAGVVTPHVSFLALEYAPEEAVANLRKMIELYDIYGEYGFYDAVKPETGRVAYKYLCLDQAMSLIALCNYLQDGSIRRRFHGDPISAKIEPLLSEEKFFGTPEPVS